MSVPTAARQVAPTHRVDAQRSSARPTRQGSQRLPPVSRLQSALGNRGMQRLLQSGAIQPKLTVGPVDDEHEREADRVAEEVVRMPSSSGSIQTRRAPQAIQRACTKCQEESQTPCPECEEKRHRAGEARGDEGNIVQATSNGGDLREPSAAAMSVIAATKGRGHPLPASARRRFESSFGYDFGDVRIHTDPRSANVASELNALAFATGSDIYFASERFQPGTPHGDRLLAHELTHTIQQTGGRPLAPDGNASDTSTIAATATGTISRKVGSSPADIIQRAGDPAAIPAGLSCPTDLTPGTPAGTDLLFGSNARAITAAHTAQLTAFRATWLAAGGNDDILVHGYASTVGQQGPNWTLSCDRAEAVRAELVRLGIPAVRISVVAHGESTDFGSSAAANQHAVVSSSTSVLPLPLVIGVLTPVDNFASRSTTRFGVGEVINLDFASLPPRPAADFGGLEWHHVAGAGTLTGVNPAGTATYTAPAAASTVRLELRVAAGATAGRVVSTHAISIVAPSDVRMTEVTGTAPTFGGVIAPGTWGAGFQANPFILPRDVSFQGVMFGEGFVAGVVTPAGSFLFARHGLPHPAGGLVPGGAGNATTGTPVLGVDSIATAGGVTPRRVFGVDFCGNSDFLWAIPWEFSVASGARTRFTTANHHVTSTLLCNATIEKAGAGPFCRRIDGTTC